VKVSTKTAQAQDRVEHDAAVFSFNDLRAAVRTPLPRTLLAPAVGPSQLFSEKRYAENLHPGREINRQSMSKIRSHLSRPTGNAPVRSNPSSPTEVRNSVNDGAPS
jgi:hypothetical protein